MNQQNYTTTTPLTDAENELIYQLSTSPDPLSRLQSNYYNLRQREVFFNYNAALADQALSGIADYKERQTLQERLLQDLDKLRREYELDIDNSIALHLAMIGVVSWKPVAA